MFEEVKEMIDSTIYTNGRGEVTAQNVNLAMHGMVDATEEGFAEVKGDVTALGKRVDEIAENGTGGGEGALRWWLAHESFGIVNTPEQTAENIATYNKLVEDKYASVILCYGVDMSSFSTYTSAPVVVHHAILGGETQMILSASMTVEEGYPMECIAVLTNPDGTMEVLTWQQTPAPNGPLTFYVGYFTTLSAEERITVEQKEHNAKMFEIYKSSPYALGVFVDLSEVYTASNGMSGRAIKTSLPYQAQYFPVETGAEAILLKEKLTNNDEIGIVILPDGSVYLANELE